MKLPSEFGTTLSSSVFKLRVPSGLRVSSTPSPSFFTRPLGLAMDLPPSALVSSLPPPTAAVANTGKDAAAAAPDGGDTSGGGSSRRVLPGR